MTAKRVQSPTCHECGKRVSADAGGFIGRGDAHGNAELLFVVFCHECGVRVNAVAQELGGSELSPLSNLRSRRTRHADG
jgi:hypothetical protein